MSTTRWIIETDCNECGEPYDGHKGPTVDGHCSGGSRIVVDPGNLPPEAIQRAARAIGDVTGIAWEMFLYEAEAAVRAFLSDPKPGDQT